MTQPTKPGPPTPVRVVLVDDHRMFRTGVRSELAEEVGNGVDIVGEAPDVDQAITVIKSTLPDVVLLDVHLPGGNGRGGVDVLAGCVAQISRTGAPIRFLALSVSDAAEDVIAVIRAGARGYVTKTISARDLATAIRRVADGDAVFSPRLAGFVLDAFGAASGELAEVDEELDRLAAISTRRWPRSCSSRSRPSRRMSRRCCANSSCPPATSSRRGRWADDSSDLPSWGSECRRLRPRMRVMKRTSATRSSPTCTLCA